MQRRELVKNGLLAVGAACVLPPKAAGWTSDSLLKPEVCLGWCTPSCSNIGMAGTYPNCYYPQYFRLNMALTNNVKAARIAAYWAIMNRTITPAQMAGVKSLGSQLTAHLSVAQTAIAEGMRLQWVAGAIHSSPSSAEVNAVRSFATSYGLDSNLATNMLYAGMPMVSNPNPALQQQILSLPNQQGLDQLNLWNDALVASVAVPPPGGICQYVGNPNNLIEAGNNDMAIGAVVSIGAAFTGPAAPAVHAVGDATFIFGFAEYAMGKMCEY